MVSSCHMASLSLYGCCSARICFSRYIFAALTSSKADVPRGPIPKLHCNAKINTHPNPPGSIQYDGNKKGCCAANIAHSFLCCKASFLGAFGLLCIATGSHKYSTFPLLVEFDSFTALVNRCHFYYIGFLGKRPIFLLSYHVTPTPFSRQKSAPMSPREYL